MCWSATITGYNNDYLQYNDLNKSIHVFNNEQR